MPSTAHELDAARLSALLARLDPAEDGACRVPGCVHHGDAATHEAPLAA